MKQCEKGHFYDDVRYSSCPYCTPAQQQTPSADSGKTVAINASAAQGGKTVPVYAAVPVSDAGKTVGVLHKKVGIDPPVAFVVCIGGAQRGKEYTLRAGRNFIGRAANMDVSLPDDETVSRENHANITYDVRSRAFILAPGESRGVAYCNGSLIVSAYTLSAYDIIEVGASKLLFLPLCGERFSWDDEQGQ